MNQYRRGGSFNDDNSAMMFSHHRHRSNDDANKAVDMVANKSAQTSFFREDPFVSVGTRKEERGRGKRRKGRAREERPITKSKNGCVLISAANITDESDEDFSDDANTTATSSVEYDSKEEDDDDDDDEIDEEQIRLEKRLDAIKARLKKFGIS